MFSSTSTTSIVSLLHRTARRSYAVHVPQGYKRIRAAVARAADRPFSVEDVYLRDPLHNEMTVRVVATGICHTDVVVKQRGMCAFPIVMGHEGVGIVERTGSGVTNFAVGDQVMMTYASCGTCPHCSVGKPAYCYDHGKLNFAGQNAAGPQVHMQHGNALYGSFFQQSSFASHVVVTENNVLHVPKDSPVPLKALAPLGCGVQTGAGAVFNTLAVKGNSSLAVFGCGAVGLSAIMAANVIGCRHIVAVDLHEPRLKLARELGATYTINGSDLKQATEEIVALTQGGANYALDTSGSPLVLRAAVDALASLGVCGIIGGSAPGTNVALDMLGLLPGKMVRGVIQGDSVPKVFLPYLMHLHAKGRFPFDRLIRYYQGLDAINEAVHDSHAGGVIKPVLVLDEQH